MFESVPRQVEAYLLLTEQTIDPDKFPTATCGSCLYLRNENNTTLCFRYPPSNIIDKTKASKYPHITTESPACGEYTEVYDKDNSEDGDSEENDNTTTIKVKLEGTLEV